MKVCVLQPDYGDSSVDYQNFDPPRNLSSLLPDCQVDHVFLRKSFTYKQIREASEKNYDIYINLCEGYLDWDIPSIDVIWSLERLNLPYTGPTINLYDPSKTLMKYVAHTQGVLTPDFIEVTSDRDLDEVLEQLQFPLFVKPAHAGDSLGIDNSSYVSTRRQLVRKCGQIRKEYGKALVEEFIPGREFTVLVAGNPDNRFEPLTLMPLEFVFPEGERFKTYDLKIKTHSPKANVPVRNAALSQKLRRAARDIFVGFEGEGYARLDFRMNDEGEIYFLEINFTCSVFYPEGYEGSADYILKHDGFGSERFLRHIIAEGISRYDRKHKKYARRKHGTSGFGIHATQDIRKGETVFRGEEKSHRLVTLDHIKEEWPPEQVDVFRRYAISLGGDVYILWDENPDEWAPQNHSCTPNAAFQGLNLVAVRDIEAGEELTLDYTTFATPEMASFECSCRSPNCRGFISFEPDVIQK
jgi:hypothetical protein